MPRHPLPYLDFPGPLAFAHRGAGPVEEENTGPAIEEAVRLGYVHVETDVQATSDGVAVLYHDDRLSRVFGENRTVAEMTWDDLRRLRSPAGAPPVRLDEMLHAFPNTRFNLDAKTWGAVEPMAQVIARAGAEDRVCIGAFNVRRTLGVVRRLPRPVAWSPSHRGVAQLYFRGAGLLLPRPGFSAAQIPQSFGPIDLITPRLLARARRWGVQVHVWTINDAAEMERLLDLGVDGVMTDDAELLRDVLIRRGEWYGTA